MPESAQPGAVALPVPAPRLEIRLGPPKAGRRGAMAPEELRAAGIYLNGGRRRGWKKRLAELLATPETTVAAWASRSRGNARPVPGAVAVAVRLMADLVREAAQGASHREAAEALATRIAALASCPAQPLRPAKPPAAGERNLPRLPDRPILIEPPQRPLAGR